MIKNQLRYIHHKNNNIHKKCKCPLMHTKKIMLHDPINISCTNCWVKNSFASEEWLRYTTKIVV